MLLLERKTKGCQDEAEDVAASYPSLLAITARHGLINPMDRLIFNGAFSRSVGLWNFKPKFEKKTILKTLEIAVKWSKIAYFLKIL